MKKNPNVCKTLVVFCTFTETPYINSILLLARSSHLPNYVLLIIISALFKYFFRIIIVNNICNEIVWAFFFFFLYHFQSIRCVWYYRNRKIFSITLYFFIFLLFPPQFSRIPIHALGIMLHKKRIAVRNTASRTRTRIFPRV